MTRDGELDCVISPHLINFCNSFILPGQPHSTQHNYWETHHRAELSRWTEQHASFVDMLDINTVNAIVRVRLSWSSLITTSTNPFIFSFRSVNNRPKIEDPIQFASLTADWCSTWLPRTTWTHFVSPLYDQSARRLLTTVTMFPVGTISKWGSLSRPRSCWSSSGSWWISCWFPRTFVCACRPWTSCDCFTSSAERMRSGLQTDQHQGRAFVLGGLNGKPKELLTGDCCRRGSTRKVQWRWSAINLKLPRLHYRHTLIKMTDRWVDRNHIIMTPPYISGSIPS